MRSRVLQDELDSVIERRGAYLQEKTNEDSQDLGLRLAPFLEEKNEYIRKNL